MFISIIIALVQGLWPLATPYSLNPYLHSARHPAVAVTWRSCRFCFLGSVPHVLQQITDGVDVKVWKAKAQDRAWMVTELISPGGWYHSLQARARVSTPRPISSGSVLLCPRWVMGHLSLCAGTGSPLLLQCPVLVSDSYPRTSEGQGLLSMDLRFQHACFLQSLVSTRTMDTNTNPSCSKTMNPDRAFSLQSGLYATMAPVAVQTAHISTVPVAVWPVETSMVSDGWPDPWHPHSPQNNR